MVTTQTHQRRVFQGLALGLIAAVLWMAWLRYLSAILPRFPASLGSGLTPWWQIRNWVSAVIIGVVVFSIRWFVGQKPKPQ